MGKRHKPTEEQIAALRVRLVKTLTALNEFYFSQKVLDETLAELVPRFGKVYRKKYEDAKQNLVDQGASTEGLEIALLDELIDLLSKRAKKRVKRNTKKLAAAVLKGEAL